MLSFGQSLFFGVGAFGVVLAVQNLGFGFWPAIGASLVITFIFALVLGYFAVKATWHYFAIITVILTLVFYYIAVGWKNLTGGDDGISFQIPLLLSLGDDSLTFYNKFVHYYFVLGAVTLSYFLLRQITRSQLGRVFLAIKENPDRAALIGYNPHKYRWIAYIVGSLFCGFAGALYCLHLRYASAHFLFWTVGGEAVMYAIVGGVGTLIGPVIGAAVLIIFKDYLCVWFENYLFIMGVITILLVLYAPQGLLGILLARKNESGKGGG
jgi:branched-chain amino acid transport system permease protein